MSETVKNTLFRFVTLRSPELLPEKDKSDYHIHHPDPEGEGYFCSKLENPEPTPAQQAAALKQMATGFNAFKKTEHLKNVAGAGIFSFSVWLAKNKTAVFNKQDISYPDGLPAALSPGTLITIWDNLFYQIITAENPQLRQQLIEVLVANGYLNALEQPWQNQLAEARVVIPSSFFGGEGQAVASRIATASSVDSTDQPVYTEDLKLIGKAVAAEKKINAFQRLLDELERAEKKYVRLNSAAYDAARKSHEQDVKRAIEEYYGGGGATGAAEAGTGDTEGAGPNIPEFNYTPLPEMEEELLLQFLSGNSFLILQQLNLVNNSTFAEATGIVKDEVTMLLKDATGKEETGSRSIIINDVVLPVSERILPVTEQYTYYMMPVYHPGGGYSILTTINMGQPGMHAASCLYTAEFNNGNNTNGAFTESAQGNSLTLEFYPNTGINVPQGITDFNFHGEINLAGGAVLEFETVFNIYEGAWGTMTLKGETGGQGGDELEIEAPTGYGVRRIGVADYRKVEQSVCCYVPGEVSHIENVMAREYKERSNRRLSRMEDTTTLERSMEKESQKDTSSSERFELQKEVNSVVSEQMSTDTHASVHGNLGKVGFDAGSSFAFNTSREDSNRNAVNYSKEVTEKALERVVQKVREERTIKVVEEFEEQNKHGFDNRQGDKHVSGVYRWIDKVYKNQVYNYGKRLMYEFMVPQPAVFHNEAVKIAANLPTATILEKPVDPRKKEGLLNMGNHSRVNTWTFPYWAGVYNADLKAAPDATICVNGSFEVGAKEAVDNNYHLGSKSFKLEIPDGYEAIEAKAGITYGEFGGNAYLKADVRIGSSPDIYLDRYRLTYDGTISLMNNPVRKELGVSVSSRNMGAVVINVTATCRRTAESYEKWQIDSFNAIIDSFNQRLDEYNKAMDALKAKPIDPTSKEINPGFYRQIENTVLRKNCITYLVKHKNLGLRFYEPGSTAEIRPIDSTQMDQYAALVKFMEQAFEWDVMSYKFYPFYWGFKGEWQQLYQQEVSDPLFRSFLQAGMARVIVSVRPGFEEAVMYFMATGKIWNGGAVPAIGDDLYLSIVEELKNPSYYIDETWETRVPSTLTLIQAGSIALNTEGLPCDCGDTQTRIVQTDTVLVGGDTPVGDNNNPEGGGGNPEGGGENPEGDGDTPPMNPAGGDGEGLG